MARVWARAMTCGRPRSNTTVGWAARWADFLDRLDARGGIKTFDFISGGDNVPWRWDGMAQIPVIDRNEFQRLALQRLRDLDIALLLSTTVAGAIVEDAQVGGVVFETGEGRRAITAKVVIDTTGEADVAAAAGAQTEDAHASAEAGFGLFFRVEDVNWEVYEEFRAAERDKPLSDEEQRWVDEVLFVAPGAGLGQLPRAKSCPSSCPTGSPAASSTWPPFQEAPTPTRFRLPRTTRT